MDGIEELLSVDVHTLTYSQQLDHAWRLEQLQARASAASVRTFAAIEAGGLPGQDPEFKTKQLVREELAMQLTISPWMAADRLSDASDLVNKVPTILALLESGETSYWHARTVVDAVEGLPQEVVDEVVARVHHQATTQTATEFKQTLNRAIASIAPETFEERHKKAVGKRGVWLRPAKDGMGWVNAYTDIADATAIYDGLTTIACTPRTVPEGEEPDPRDQNQQRVDALASIVSAAAAAAEVAAELGGQPMPKRHGQRPTVQISVAMSTLAGLDIQPGELIGYGPIPASLALRIAFDQTGTWRRLITDDTGRALDFPLKTYRPPADLRDFILARDFTCRAPGCNRLARNCDIDHHVDYVAGGETSSLNNGPLCGRNHQVKHEARWLVNRSKDGVTHWQSITGRKFEKPPDRHPVDRTVSAPAARRSPLPDVPPF